MSLVFHLILSIDLARKPFMLGDSNAGWDKSWGAARFHEPRQPSKHGWDLQPTPI